MNTMLRVLVIGLGVALGCSSTSSPLKSGVRHEPAIIAIRNNTGRPLESVSILEDREVAAGQARRMGGMSPVAENFTYTFVRPTKPPPLPARVRVVFKYPREAEQVSIIDIRPALRQTTGAAGEALIFELRPGPEAVTYIEVVQP